MFSQRLARRLSFPALYRLSYYRSFRSAMALQRPADRPPSQSQAPRRFPSSGFENIDPSQLVEEEKLPSYNRDEYYPMRIGDVLKGRYQVIAKLGYGTTSTVWLSRDLSDGSYHVLKVHINTLEHNRELEIFKRLAGVTADHDGRDHVRKLQDSFKVESPTGEHEVFVMEPLGMSMRTLQDLHKDSVLPPSVVKGALDQLVVALNFVHEAGLIHTDLHSDNLLISLPDDTILSQIEENEMRTPSARKELNSRVTYVSRYMLGGAGKLIVCDFGQARVGDRQRGNAMPVPYRAPEIILDMEWDSAVDIWSLGLLSWDFLEREPLFEIYDKESTERNDAHHLAAMTALLGPPPAEFLTRSAQTSKYWDSTGVWKGPVPLPAARKLDSIMNSLDGNDKNDFLDLLSGLLCWLPEDRISAGQAYYHQWLRGRSQNTSP